MKPCCNSLTAAELNWDTQMLRVYPAQYTWPQTPFPVTEEWAEASRLSTSHHPPHPTPTNLPIQSTAGKMKQINTNSDYLRPVYTTWRKRGWKKELYGGWIIVTVVVISAAATVITIRFDFIWECLHSCSPLTPLTPPLPTHPTLPPPPRSLPSLLSP